MSMEPINLTCKACGCTFKKERVLGKRGRMPKYCGDECRKQKNRERQNAPPARTTRYSRVCGYCGTYFQAKKPRIMFCSSACASKARAATTEKTCDFCAAPLNYANDTTRFCSKACRDWCHKLEGVNAARYERATAAKMSILACCQKCNKAFLKTSTMKDATTCSDCKYAKGQDVTTRCVKCHSEFTYTRPYAKRMCEPCQIDSVRQMKRRAKHKRRAAEQSVPYETINSEEIFERDAWCCYLCGELVQRYTSASFIGVMPNEATIDHVYPISKGGWHTKDNVRTACRVCNSAKSASVGGWVDAADNRWSGEACPMKKNPKQSSFQRGGQDA